MEKFPSPSSERRSANRSSKSFFNMFNAAFAFGSNSKESFMQKIRTLSRRVSQLPQSLACNASLLQDLINSCHQELKGQKRTWEKYSTDGLASLPWYTISFFGNFPQRLRVDSPRLAHEFATSKNTQTYHVRHETRFHYPFLQHLLFIY